MAKLNGTVTWLGIMVVAIGLVTGGVVTHTNAANQLKINAEKIVKLEALREQAAQVKANTKQLERLDDIDRRLRRMEQILLAIAIRAGMDVDSLLEG